MKDPKKAIVNVSFIGGSVVEVLTDSSYKSQTLQELKEADLTHIKDFDMFEDSMKKSRG